MIFKFSKSSKQFVKQILFVVSYVFYPLSSFLVFILSLGFNLNENHPIIMIIKINEAVFSIFLVIEGAIVEKSYLTFVSSKIWKVFNIGCGVISG